jgi:uncharacterized protein (UPF0332 family)
MPVIANKSDFNLQAAEELIKKNLYAPSVHCSYYGCFQKMKSILSQRLSVPYEKIDQIIVTNRCSEHWYVRDTIIKDLSRRLSADFAKNVDKYIKKLYQFRINADYKDVEILSNTANDVMHISNDVITQLRKVYKL